MLQDAVIRQKAEEPEMLRLLSTVLLLRGRKWATITTDPDKPGDWGLYYKAPNLHDLVAQAQARFLNAQANMMERGMAGQVTTVRNQDQEVNVGSQAASRSMA